MKRHLALTCFLGSTLLALVAGAPSANAEVTFQGLGDLPAERVSSGALAASADGTYTVGWGTLLGKKYATLWEAARSGMQPAHNLGTLPGYLQSMATGATESMVVGYSYSNDTRVEGFFWSKARGMVGLGGLPRVSVLSSAAAISATGSTIVGYSNSERGKEAFRWTIATRMVALGDLPGGAFDSEATAVSADGQVIVGNGMSANGKEAFRWTRVAGMVGLGDLPGGSFESTAEAVSQDGIAIVGQSSSANGREAYILSQRTRGGGAFFGLGMTPLGDFQRGDFNSCAKGVINTPQGEMVVGYGTGAQGKIAFLWTKRLGFADLKTVLAPLVAIAGDWQLTSANSISYKRGVITIVGTGLHGGKSEGFKVTSTTWIGDPPPTPARPASAASPTPEQLQQTFGITFQGLDGPTGQPVSSYARGVSNEGRTVVGSAIGMGAGQLQNRKAEAFIWPSNSARAGLGALPFASASPSGTSTAAAVSANGETVVGNSSLDLRREAFRWTRSEGLVSLGDFPGGLTQSFANGVSADGSVIVGYGTTARGGEAFRWTQAGGMVGIGDLPGGRVYSIANGVSRSGDEVVGWSSSTEGEQAFRWTQAGGMVGLGDLPGGTFRSQATAIAQEVGIITGFATSERGQEAFRWSPRGGMQPLGDLPGGRFFSIGTSISGMGGAVVGYGSTAGGYEAFIWTTGEGMLRLEDSLKARGFTLPRGWTLTRAEAISPDGLVIVGLGKHNGRSEGFVIRSKQSWDLDK